MIVVYRMSPALGTAQGLPNAALSILTEWQQDVPRWRCMFQPAEMRFGDVKVTPHPLPICGVLVQSWSSGNAIADCTLLAASDEGDPMARDPMSLIGGKYRELMLYEAK